jgi:hypothetical protein
MAHGYQPTPESAIASFPSLIADLEGLQRDLVSAAVDVYDGRMLDIAGVLEHILEHLHDVREALGLERVDSIMRDIEDADRDS